MTEEKVLVQVRLPKSLVRQVDHLAVDHDLYRVHMVEQLLREALRQRQAASEEGGGR